MRPYEVMIILDAGLEEESIRSIIDRTTQLISNGGGNPRRVERWGRRRFAYAVNHRQEGYYVLVEATAEPEAMATLDRALHLSDEVLRHKVIRIPDRVAGRASRSVPPPGEPEPPSSPAAPDAAAGLAAPEAASGTSTSANGA